MRRTGAYRPVDLAVAGTECPVPDVAHGREEWRLCKALMRAAGNSPTERLTAAEVDAVLAGGRRDKLDA